VEEHLLETLHSEFAIVQMESLAMQQQMVLAKFAERTMHFLLLVL
jgi:hypothetical protein